MSLDSLADWLFSQPLMSLALACALLVLGAFIGFRWARRHGAGRAQAAEVVQTVVKPAAEAKDRPPKQIFTRANDFDRWETSSAHEWDGGQPRPNWNRRSG